MTKRELIVQVAEKTGKSKKEVEKMEKEIQAAQIAPHFQEWAPWVPNGKMLHGQNTLAPHPSASSRFLANITHQSISSVPKKPCS